MVKPLRKVILKNVLKGHKTLILNLAWSADGKTLATAGLDGLIRLWNMEEDGRPAGVLEGYTNFALCLAWSPDNHKIAAGTHQGTIEIWDTAAGKIITRLEGHQDSVNTLSWSPADGRLASGSYDCKVKIWNPDSPGEIETLSVDDGFIQAAVFSPDSRVLAAGSRKGIIRSWAVESLQVRETINTQSQGVFSLAWSGSGRRLAAGCGNGDILLRDTGAAESRIIKGHEAAVTGLSFYPGLDLLATKSKDHTIRIWDSRRLECLRVFKEPHSGYNQANLCFHPSKPLLACLAEGEKRIRIWEFLLSTT